jgi:hypothetical protein
MAYETSTLISDFESSGLSQKEFCESKGVKYSTFRYHLSKKRRADGRPTEPSCRESGGFVPLRVERPGGSRTVIVIHGRIETDEIVELLRTISA